jgi:pyruvate dehydrogenase E1 component
VLAWGFKYDDEGRARAHFLLEQLLEHARQHSIDMPFSATTGYVNTIEPDQEERCPGNLEIEERLRAYMRWNAMAMVVKANRHNPADGGDLGGHIGSFASLATCLARASTISGTPRARATAATALHPGPQCRPGLCPRLPGRPPDRRAVAQLPPGSGRQGPVQLPAPQADARVLAVPHRVHGPGPADGHLPGAFSEVPARPRHCQHRKPQGLGVLRRRRNGRARKLGAIGLAARENLDNLVFVINCNLQRLDGPVRGNGKIIQELEGEFRGSGWNVIKLLWGSWLGPAAGARQGRRKLRKIMMDTLDGDYQAFKANDGAYVRKHFFGRDPRTLEMVAKMSDDDIWNLRRGGHDPKRCTPPSTAREPQGPAHRAADQDRQGFWHGQGR